MTTSSTAAPTTSRVVSAAPLARPDEFADAVSALTGETVVVDQLKGFVGRNDNWLVPTESGEDLFVKCLRGNPTAVAERIRRVLSFEETIGQHPPTHFRTVPFRGAVADMGMLVFDHVPQSRVSSELLQDDDLRPEQARSFGRIVAEVHSLPRVADLPGENGGDARSDPFYALSAEDYAKCSGGEVEAWAMLQHDKVLMEALARLREVSEAVPAKASHADMRLDQFLLHGDATYVIDWEEFRYSDPARDIGGIVGEFLHHAAMRMFSELDVEDGLAPGAAHEALLAQGQAELDRVSEHIGAFWDGYRSHAEIDDDLPVRATAQAGWFFFDRLLAVALHGARLSAAERGMAGIGRNALTDPEQFAPTIGLTKD